MKLIETSIIIVTWNNEKDIKTCLESIFNQSSENFNVIVVDNASTDNTVQIIKENFKDKVVVVQNKENKFLTGGNNIGIKYAFENYNPNFILVLNPDTMLERKALETLVREISQDSKVGAVGPKLKFFNNDNEGLVNSTGLFFDGFNQAYDLNFMKKDLGKFDYIEEVFGVSGACILFRSEMLEDIGLYDERIKLYLDEVELFIRAEKKGWIAKYVGTATVYHSYMHSMNQSKLTFINNEKRKAWLRIALKHYSMKSKLAMLKKYFIK